LALFVNQQEEENWITIFKNHPEATTGTYAGLWAPPRAHKYSKWAAIAASENPG
jgi:hypothetical protein